MKRCAWATSPHMIAYHDEEWGLPVHDDGRLFEFLVLEGAQAGLSWDTVLRKRDRYREVFDNFDPARVAKFNAAKVAKLMADPGIIRNRMKIEAAIAGAKAFLKVQAEFGSFDAYLWGFVDGKPVKRTSDERLTRTDISDSLSKDLKKRGFNFVGTTICYAFMQAIGMVNDHERGCFRRREVGG